MTTTIGQTPRSHWGRRRIRASAMTLVAVWLLAPVPVTAQPADEEREKQAVVAAVQRLFDAMSSCDAAEARAVLSAEGRLFRLVPDSTDASGLRSTSHAEFAASLETCPRRLLERMWAPQVRVHKGIASLWTPYDFWLDGEFSHCGVDSFDLARTDEGWKVTGGIYTVEREGCAPSPLGPPSFTAKGKP